MLGDMDFADRHEAGARLTEPVRTAVLDAAAKSSITVIAIAPGGVPVARPIVAALSEFAANTVLAEVRYLDGKVSGSAGETAALPSSIAATDLVIVVADGVETGRAAMAVAAALASAGWSRRWLAVPVCPRQSRPALDRRYERVIALVTPLARRSLRWHYREWAED